MESQISTEGFWEKKDKAKTILDSLKEKKKIFNPFISLKSRIEDINILLEFLSSDESLIDDVSQEVTEVTDQLSQLEVLSFLSYPNDENNAYLSINSGAGGTESCDWAMMLYRMYCRWAEKKGFSYEIINMHSGEEAGIKSCVIFIKGSYANGFLRSEVGVHRLVRISPFDSNKRRHTSFAAVEVVAEINDNIDVNIEEKDLKYDYFRASGAGGQHVNTTDSAVRVTHVPSGVQVACQMERSQHKNKATALKLLKSRLYQIELEKQKEADNQYNQSKQENGWGSQIRSYVLHPYKMIKDLRTNTETSNVNNVLDGDIDSFIENFLRSKFNKK